MMVPNKSLLLGATLLCLGTAATAQQGNQHYRRVNKPLEPAALDLQTGTVTRGAAVVEKATPGFTSSSVLNNLDHSGFVGVDTGPGAANGPCEWIIAANKGSGVTGGSSTFMTGFIFAYCSAAQSTLSGGPGGFARIGFRSGYALGTAANLAGPSGTDVGTINVSGLPAWTGCASIVTGGFNCFLIRVTTGNSPIVLPDGPIGWSWQYRDTDSITGVLAKTFPFLACIQSCTPNGAWPAAGGAGPDQTGDMVNITDQYCPAGSLLSSFSFATVANGSYYTSISMDLREINPSAAVAATFGAGNGKTMTADPPVFNGTTFNMGLDLDCTGATGGSVVIIRVAFAPTPPPLATKWGIVYVAVTAGTGQNFIIPGASGGMVPFGGTFPVDLTLFGACWSAQGYCGGSTPLSSSLSNATFQSMGTF